MTRPTDPLFDERLAAWLDGDPDTAPVDALKMVLTTFPSVAQQHAVHRMPRRFPTMSMPTRVAAAAIIGVLAFGGAVYVIRPSQPAVGGPTATSDASFSPSQPAVVGPSATPTATPSPTPSPILWTQASLKEDWPGPVRPEPTGGAIVVPIMTTFTEGRHIDPSGDTGSDDFPWVDIQEVRVGPGGLSFTLPKFPPDVDPTEQWIAYGVVFDDDRDGVPDRRIGKDNTPGTVAGWNENYRVWITDLHTGRTVVEEGGYVGETYVNAWSHGRFTFGSDTTGGGHKGTSLVNLPLYVWASVIQDGRVVATDYAPDVRWLLLDPGSTPQVESSPSPGPTPQVEDDPAVPGGRLWTTSVVNNSPDPATLFVAEDDESGRMGRLVGTVTPNVVPSNTTMKVTFALPPEGSRGWAIFVNPGPKQGGLNWQDVPAYGEYRIQADGTSGWRSLIP